MTTAALGAVYIYHVGWCEALLYGRQVYNKLIICTTNDPPRVVLNGKFCSGQTRKVVWPHSNQFSRNRTISNDVTIDLANFCRSCVSVMLWKLWTADSRTRAHLHCAHLHNALTTSYARTYIEVISTAATQSDTTEVHRCSHNCTYVSTWNFGSTGSRWSEIADFQPIFARSASVWHLATRVRLTLIGSPLRAFQWA